MPSFTVPLRRVYEIMDGHIGLDNYPIFDEDYRTQLNNKIIEHYWFREIGIESVEMFTFFLARRMNEIMPMFNQYYLSERIEIDPLATIDIKTLSNNDMNAVVSGSAINNATSDGKSRNVTSDTPQGQLSNDGNYATGLVDAVSEGTSTSEATETNNTEQVMSGESQTVGTQGSQADMLMRYRATFLNIDMDVIAALEDLFMLVMETSGDYTQGM